MEFEIKDGNKSLDKHLNEVQNVVNNHQKISQNILRPTNSNLQNQNSQATTVFLIVPEKKNSELEKKNFELEKKNSELEKKLSEQKNSDAEKISELEKKNLELEKKLSEQKNSDAEQKISVPEKKFVEEKKSLTDEEVTNHTASLWKNNPVPKDEPEPTKDIEKNSHSTKNFQVVAARVRGKKHKHEGSNCDDWFETDEVDGVVLSAVSDGAGSKKFSRIGSKISCKAAVKFLKTEISAFQEKNPEFKKNLSAAASPRKFNSDAGSLAEILHKSILKAREAVVEAFEERKNNSAYTKVIGRKLELNDFAATFLLSIIVPISDNETFVMACQIGDGMILAFDENKNLTKICEGDSGKFAGETDFLTSEAMSKIENLQHRTKVSRKNFEIILSMTDGVADDYETKPQKLFDDLVAQKILSNDSPSDKLANWLDSYTIRGSFDDRTLVVIKKRGVDFV